MPSPEDFINIPYSYTNTPPGINCFQLAQKIRSRYHAPPLPDFDYAIADYPAESSLPSNFILDQLQEYAQPITEAPAKHLDLVALRFGRWIALGTVLENSGTRFVVFMGIGDRMGDRSQVVPLERMRTIESVWRYVG